jgi:hypothetical protein
VDGLVDFSVGIGHFGTFDDVQHLLTSMDSMVMQGAWWTKQQFVDAPNSISELFDSFGFWCLGWNIPNWSEPWRGIHLTHLSHLYAHFGQWCWDAQDSNCHHFSASACFGQQDLQTRNSKESVTSSKQKGTSSHHCWKNHPHERNMEALQHNVT